MRGLKGYDLEMEKCYRNIVQTLIVHQQAWNSRVLVRYLQHTIVNMNITVVLMQHHILRTVSIYLLLTNSVTTLKPLFLHARNIHANTTVCACSTIMHIIIRTLPCTYRVHAYTCPFGNTLCYYAQLMYTRYYSLCKLHTCAISPHTLAPFSITNPPPPLALSLSTLSYCFMA